MDCLFQILTPNGNKIGSEVRSINLPPITNAGPAIAHWRMAICSGWVSEQQRWTDAKQWRAECGYLYARFRLGWRADER